MRILTAALLLALPATAGEPDGKLKVFILAGQSNMEGKAKMSLLKYQITAPETKDFFAHLHKGGTFVERDDVWIKYLDRNGKLTVGYGSRNCIGPELQFGHTMGDAYDAPVLIIKTAWGGKSLFRDFRPPSSGMPPAEELEKQLANRKKRSPNTTMDEIKAGYGHYYRLMIEDVTRTLADVKKYCPAYKGQGYELAGFVWFQGWNDMINTTYTAEYTKNMANFIRDVRKDLKAPDLPFVIGQMGVGGVENNKGKMKTFKDAQATGADADPSFKGNVSVVKTDQYWDMTADAVYKKGWKKHLEEWNTVGSDRPYHYLGSAKCHLRMGKAFAESILKMRGEAN